MASTYSGSGGGTSGPVAIPEVYTDPLTPLAGSVWVLALDQGTGGSPLGLLLSLTHAVSIFTYQLSYRTTEGTTIRTVLS